MIPIQPFFIETKKKYWGLLEGRWYTYRNLHQFGLNWLCEPGDKSYKPQYFFSISMKNGCLLTIVYKFITRLAGNFFSYHYMLGTTVFSTSILEFPLKVGEKPINKKSQQCKSEFVYKNKCYHICQKNNHFYTHWISSQHIW